MKTTYKLSFLIAALSSTCANAHHGEEFFTLHSHSHAHSGDAYIHSAYAWEKYDSGDEMSNEYGLYYSPLANIGLSLDAQFADRRGRDWDLESIMPMVHLHLTDCDADTRFKIGAAIGYHFANEQDGGHQAMDSISMHGSGHHMGAMMHEETTSSAHHVGIHNHDADQWMGRLAASTMIGKTKVVGNLIVSVPEGDHAYWGYGVGLRRGVLNDLFVLGLEANGDFDADLYHEMIGSIHYDVTDAVTFRVGAGFGLSDHSPDFVLRTGLVWKF